MQEETMVRSTKLLTMLWLCLAACGCAQAPVAPLTVPAVSIWLDDAFELPPGSAQPGGDDLFALEPALLDRLNEAVAAAPTAQGRLDTLISLIYDAPQRPFSYAYHSTVARVTWQARRGDCLSLTVMAYALARALGLQAHMQEVSVPVSFDRRDGVDFVAGHINLYIQESDAGGLDTRRPSQHGVVIDFEPQVGSPRIGTKLSADQVKARYFNNLGADHLAQGDAKRAYAFLKAAIQTDSRFSPPYSNLALLYQRHGQGGLDVGIGLDLAGIGGLVDIEAHLGLGRQLGHALVGGGDLAIERGVVGRREHRAAGERQNAGQGDRRPSHGLEHGSPPEGRQGGAAPEGAQA